MLKVIRALYAARCKYQNFIPLKQIQPSTRRGWARTIEKPDVAIRFFVWATPEAWYYHTYA